MKTRRAMTEPIVALTIGDPAGIGPEIVLKMLRKRSLVRTVRLVIVGDPFVLESASQTSLHNPDLPTISSFEELPGKTVFPILFNCGHPRFRIRMGHVDARCGRLSLDYLRTAVKLAMRGMAAGIVTAPINKQAWALAGSKFHGHTEMLAHLSRSKRFAMAFYAKNFLTVLLSTHISLKDAVAELSSDSLRRAIHLAANFLQETGIRRARIAVAGVNPHAGEDGLLGDEERNIFYPEIRRWRRKNVRVSGPFPADSVYLRAARGEFDAVIAPYHDQAMLAVKALSFGHATNITLGLPFVRTSLDHGTAFDIAGRGVADETALVEATKRCRSLILARKKVGRTRSIRRSW
jgi:4-hydroxythreonine-4-phosphate dehydrogenase